MSLPPPSFSAAAAAHSGGATSLGSRVAARRAENHRAAAGGKMLAQLGPDLRRRALALIAGDREHYPDRVFQFFIARLRRRGLPLHLRLHRVLAGEILLDHVEVVI